MKFLTMSSVYRLCINALQISYTTLKEILGFAKSFVYLLNMRLYFSGSSLIKQ